MLSHNHILSLLPTPYIHIWMIQNEKLIDSQKPISTSVLTFNISPSALKVYRSDKMCFAYAYMFASV